jgi:hypothetical protein
MYVKSLHLYDFKCFAKAALDLRYPGEPDPKEGFGNINLILGDNGGGKSSVLRAIAIAALAPAIIGGGFVPYRLVRRVPEGPHPKESLLKIKAVLSPQERGDGIGKPPVKRRRANGRPKPEAVREMLARLRAGPRGDDRLHLESTPSNPIDELLHDSYSPTFFIVGYGATRRVEGRGYSPESAARSRKARYQRIASLFEDSMSLRPMHAWLPNRPDRMEEVTAILNATLPDSVRFDGRLEGTDEYLFMHDGLETPFQSLSDGYRAFIGWMADLLGHLCDVCPEGTALKEQEGIVLVDEIDLHLHPSWQLTVVEQLSKALPKLQFVFSSHSPLIANTVHRHNVHVTGHDEDGMPTIMQLEENLYARGAEGVLLSPYFGLESTLPQAVTDMEAQQIEKISATIKGDGTVSRDSIKEALAFMKMLKKPGQALKAGTTGMAQD